jgi:hypothetical protein
MAKSISNRDSLSDLFAIAAPKIRTRCIRAISCKITHFTEYLCPCSFALVASLIKNNLCSFTVWTDFFVVNIFLAIQADLKVRVSTFFTRVG